VEHSNYFKQQPVGDSDRIEAVGFNGKPKANDHSKVIEWPQPVDFLIDQDTLPPVLLAEHCPDALWPFVVDTSERMGVDRASVELACLVTCSSVITDDWHLQPKRFDYTWTEQARLWGLILGPPSILKTPVIYACTKPIDKLEAEARENYKTEKRAHRIAHDAWRKTDGSTPEPTPPKLPRYLVENASMEAFSEILRDDDEAKMFAPAKKVLSRQDEMSEFVANLDKYNSTGRSGGDQGAYCRLYNGGRFSLDRIIRGNFATNWSAGFIGGVQPGPIQRIAKSASEDGMLQRFAFSVPGHQGPGVDRAPDSVALDRYHALIPALAATHPPSNVSRRDSAIVFHEAAHRHREAINALARAMAALPDTSNRLKAAFGKWPGLFARLCLTFHMIDLVDGKLSGTERPYMQVIPEKTARKVAAYMQDILLPHLLRADSVMFSTTQTGHARWIAGYILSRKLETITTRDVVRAYRDLQSPESRDELNSVMASLVAVGWLEPVPSDNPVKAVSNWLVNPLVHTMNPEKAERERERREQARALAEENFEAIRRMRAGRYGS
jgi:hypothetical protein